MRSCAVFLVFCLGVDLGICKYDGITSRKPIITPSNNVIKYDTIPTTKITIPILIHLDKALTRGLSREYRKTIRNYFREVLNGVEGYFGQPSMNQTVHFTLLDVKMLRNTTRKFQMNEHVSKYLKSYCRWQGEKKRLKKKWYFSVLFTGLDLFYLDGRQRKVRSSTGRGYLGGICSINYSCSVLEWHEEYTDFLIAHEIAHSLGVSHDDSSCLQHPGQRYIMDANYNTKNPASTWSPCSRKDFDKFMMSKRSQCLQLDSARPLFP